MNAQLEKNTVASLQRRVNRAVHARGHHCRIKILAMPSGNLSIDAKGINSGETIRGMNLALYLVSGEGWNTSLPAHSGNFASAKAGRRPA